MPPKGWRKEKPHLWGYHTNLTDRLSELPSETREERLVRIVTKHYLIALDAFIRGNINQDQFKIQATGLDLYSSIEYYNVQHEEEKNEEEKMGTYQHQNPQDRVGTHDMMRFNLLTKCKTCNGEGRVESSIDLKDVLLAVHQSVEDGEVQKPTAIQQLREDHGLGLKTAEELVEGAMALYEAIQKNTTKTY